ncbi:MAG: succinate dehydrogenase cytochrome b subunit [bacterium]
MRKQTSVIPSDTGLMDAVDAGRMPGEVEENMNISWIVRLVTSSVGRKFFMAVSGLALIGFVAMHLAGNLLLLKGEADYNHYSELLLGNPLIRPAEIALACIFLVHIICGIWVRIEDWRARPVGYVKRKWEGGRTVGSATMLYTGILMLFFLGYHAVTFRFGDQSKGMYMMVFLAFRNPVYVCIYVLTALALLVKFSHGFQSAFQTMGFNHPKYTPWIKLAGWLLALAMIGFAAIPLWFLIKGGAI